MVSRKSETDSEASRLEELWSGGFGDSYLERNRSVDTKRMAFWQTILNEIEPKRILEVGCNLGGNLRCIASRVPVHSIYGVDVNLKALANLQRDLPGVNALWAVARELPFRDSWFDLVFTMGVLIHQPEQSLPLVMAEIVRCSRRYVLCGEYCAEQTAEISYRGEKGALFKRDYGRIYRELFPGLELRKQGLLSREDGFDDVTYWLFEKS